MTLHARLTILERRQPPDDAAYATMVATILDTLAGADGDEAIPDRMTVLAAVTAGTALACRSHLFRRCGEELLIREYVGIDLRLVGGET